ncbi:MAG: EVE domain-containing protein [Planctomycetes bacterium]|nr:EVE domain-containing protein [Planctomycetota bacterium]
MRYWLIKSEPGDFSIDDLKNSPKRTTMWDGVRNYQARNFMKDDMRIGAQVLFYHSVHDPAIVGLATVASEPYPDPTQWDAKNDHYDPKSPKDAPRWYLVDITFVEKFAHPLPLPMLRSQKQLAGMELLRRGSRLSVQPVRKNEFDAILALATK